MRFAQYSENENKYVTLKYANEDVKATETRSFNKYPEDIDHDNFSSERYNRKFIINLLAGKNLTGRVFFYFNDRTDFISLCSDGQLNVRGCKDHLFKFWGNSEFRNIKPNSVFEKLEDKVIKVNFIPFSGSRNFLFNSFSKFIRWLEDNSSI